MSKKATTAKKPVPTVKGSKGLTEKPATALQVAMHNANVLAHISQPSILANPISTIDRLRRYSTFHGARAHSSLCYTLGLFAINALSWQHVENTRPAMVKPTTAIDIFNDGYAKADIDRESAQNIEEQGLAALPRTDGLLLVGAYKQMLAEICEYNADEAKRLMPDVIFARMQSSRDDVATTGAYDDFTSTHANMNAVKELLQAEIKRQQARRTETIEKNAVAKLDHVLGSLQKAPRDQFDDKVWECIPLHKQYSIVRMVMTETLAAAAAEMRKPVDERVNEFDLIDMASELKLELDAADRDPEVKLAFEVGKLQPLNAPKEPVKTVVKETRVIKASANA